MQLRMRARTVEKVHVGLRILWRGRWGISLGLLGRFGRLNWIWVEVVEDEIDILCGGHEEVEDGGVGLSALGGDEVDFCVCGGELRRLFGRGNVEGN